MRDDCTTVSDCLSAPQSEAVSLTSWRTESDYHRSRLHPRPIPAMSTDKRSNNDCFPLFHFHCHQSRRLIKRRSCNRCFHLSASKYHNQTRRDEKGFFFVCILWLQLCRKQQLLLLLWQHLFAVRMSTCTSCSCKCLWHVVISSCQLGLAGVICAALPEHNLQLPSPTPAAAPAGTGNSLPASLLITFAYFCVRIDNSKSKSKRLPPAHVAGQEFIDNATSSIMAISLQAVGLPTPCPVLPLLLLHSFWPCLLHKNVECRAAFVTYYMTVATVRPISILFATPAITHTHTGTHNIHTHPYIQAGIYHQYVVCCCCCGDLQLCLQPC